MVSGKARRRFVMPRRRMVVFPMPPDMNFYDVEYDGVTHVLVCQKCGGRFYTDSKLVDILLVIKEKVESDGIPLDYVLPRHKPCHAVMTLVELGQEEVAPL